MKKIILKFSLIMLCTQLSLFSMDPITTPSQEELIKQISHDINVKYASNRIHNEYFYALTDIITQLTLTPEQSLDIIKVVEQRCARNTALDLPDTFDKLCSQNGFFESAINELTRFASENLKLLTANNITTIENPQKQQPTPALNQLSLPIKTYVMNRALEEINYTYDIVLKGQHQDDIQAFGICELTDQAVTGSFKKKPNLIENYVNSLTSDNVDAHNWNNLFFLWDLKTGKAIRQFNELSPINLLAFNPNGSCIAAAMYNENIVKIWCPKTGQLLHTLFADYPINHIVYSYPKPCMLTAVHFVNKGSRMTQWLLTDTKAGMCLNSMIIQGPTIAYDSKYPIMPVQKNELHITKKNCIPFSICMLAIEKTNTMLQNKLTPNIEKSKSFHELTDVERTNIYTAIQRKQALNQNGNTLELRSLNK